MRNWSRTSGGETARRPAVSVVVPTYRRAATVRAAVLSLLAQDLHTADYEIIVVDSSLDKEVVTLVEELQSMASCALTCRRKEPEGPGPSRNLGAASARAEIVAFMDSDCRADPGWLRAGLAAFEETVGLVQGRTLPDPACRQGIFTRYLSVERENFIYECANIFYRKSALSEAGGFLADSNPRAESPMGGEDVELAWRVKRNGWKSRFAPAAVVHHEVVPISPWRWLFGKRLYIWPRLARNVPELRRFFFARYFLDREQAAFALGLAGSLLAPLVPLTLTLWAPYALLRGSQRTRTLGGLLRPLRVLVYLVKDTLSFAILLVGSVRFRSLLM